MLGQTQIVLFATYHDISRDPFNIASIYCQISVHPDAPSRDGLIINQLPSSLPSHNIFPCLPRCGACSTSGLFRRSLASAKASASGLCWIAVHTTSTSARSLVKSGERRCRSPKKNNPKPGLWGYGAMELVEPYIFYYVHSHEDHLFGR